MAKMLFTPVPRSLKDIIMFVFVYGTLKNGCCNHHILTPFIKTRVSFKASTVEKYPMYKGESYFPFLENQPGIGNHIIGHIFEIDDDNMHRLDRFEGVPHLYKREMIKIQRKDKLFDCIVYFKSKETDLKDKQLISEWIE